MLSIPSQELNAAISELSAKLENLRTCNDLISKNGRALQNALTELEGGDDLANREKTKLVTERATLFRISSNAMINVSIGNVLCILQPCPWISRTFRVKILFAI